jgi:hypothetical protein
MEKIPCIDCGAMILPATAESTGGLCMACKQGIRNDIEASRAYYERLKAYDPARELWKSLVERSSDGTLAQLSTEEQRYFAVSLLESEVYNGGLDQFFSNSSGDFYHLAIEGMNEIGASSALAIAGQAAEIVFGSSVPPLEREERLRLMNSQLSQLSEVSARFRQSSRLESLDKQFCEDADHLSDRLMAYAEEKGLLISFLKGGSEQP